MYLINKEVRLSKDDFDNLGVELCSLCHKYNVRLTVADGKISIVASDDPGVSRSLLVNTDLHDETHVKGP